jgi:SAM-dependent methyltransferase
VSRRVARRAMIGWGCQPPWSSKAKKMHQKNYWERKELDKRRPVTHPVIEEYVLSKIEKLKKYILFTEKTVLLDVGCGNGFFTWYFERICHVTGVDFSQKMLELNPVKRKLLMEAEALAFKDNSFEVVFCHALLHHVADLDRVIREMKRVSKKYIILLEPNRNNPLMFLFSALVKEERKALKFSPGYLQKVSERNGLRVIKSFSCGMIVPNKMPLFLLPLAKRLHFNQPLGMTNFIIAEKEKPSAAARDKEIA